MTFKIQYPRLLEELESKEQFIIVTQGQHSVPPYDNWDKSSTGYHLDMQTFDTKEEWEKEIHSRMLDKTAFSTRNQFKAFRLVPAKVNISVSVQVTEGG